MPENLVGEEAPPPYEECAYPGSSITSQNSNQPELNSGYTPVQYNHAGQDPQKFYGLLIDESNRPSEIFCRMADALFFHLDQHCNQFRGTQYIEPAKIAWLEVTLGKDTVFMSAHELAAHLPSLYDAASIPYTFNNTQTPILDRRGHLHLCIFGICARPAYAQQQWNKALNVLKLHDPLTNVLFPTPIPRSAFPSVPNFPLKRVYNKWQIKAGLDLSRQRSQAMPAQYQNEYAKNNTPHNLLKAAAGQQANLAQALMQVEPVQHVPIARRAFQTTQQLERLQKIHAAKRRLMQLDADQDFHGQAFDTARASEGPSRLEEVTFQTKG